MGGVDRQGICSDCEQGRQILLHESLYTPMREYAEDRVGGVTV